MLTLSAGGKVADNSELLASDKTWLTPGAQLTKFAWRIITGPADQDRYYTRPARIALAADDTLDGVARCLDVTVGLVGIHLVQRVASGNGDRWIWSSFEHVDNVPLAVNARRPNSIIAKLPQSSTRIAIRAAQTN